MGQEPQGEHHPRVEVNGADQAKLIAAHVEHRHFPSALHGHQISGRKRPAQLGEGTSADRAHDFDPLPQRNSGAGVVAGPLPDGAFGDDAHGDKLSSTPFPVNAEDEYSVERNPPVLAERGLSQTAARRQTELLGNYRQCERYSTRCKLGLLALLDSRPGGFVPLVRELDRARREHG